jgi:hypothetical protein
MLLLLVLMTLKRERTSPFRRHKSQKGKLFIFSSKMAHKISLSFSLLFFVSKQQDEEKGKTFNN